VAGNFIGEGNWGTQRKLATCHNSFNPFSLLDGLADPFVRAYEATFGVIKSVKEAYNILKER
jgi:hypothetical protein